MVERNLSLEPLDPATENIFTSWPAVVAAMGLPASSQPLDTDLTAIAALTTTPFGRSLLTLANAGVLAADAAFASRFGWPVPVVESGLTRSLVAVDCGTTIRCTNAARVTVTIPTDAALDLDDGFWVALVSEGAGGLTLSTTGITLAGSQLKTVATGQTLVLTKTATANTWVVVGGVLS